MVFGTTPASRPALDLAALDGSQRLPPRRAAGVVSAAASVSAAGDVNGDGIDDLIIGAPAPTDGGNSAGHSYVVFGTDAGFAASLDLAALDGSDGFRLDGLRPYDDSGFSVSGCRRHQRRRHRRPDRRGRNFTDSYYTAGAQLRRLRHRRRFRGEPRSRHARRQHGFRLDGVSDGDLSGTSVSAAGDVNGDGIDDLIIGAPGADGDAGASYVVFGFRTEGTSTTEASVTASPDDAEQAGAPVHLASQDLDIGDGRKLVGLRFTGVEIPEGATITGAHIEFQARLSGGCPADLTIASRTPADATTFGSGGDDIAGRDLLDQTTAWSPEAWTRGETYDRRPRGDAHGAGRDRRDRRRRRFCLPDLRRGRAHRLVLRRHGEAPKLVIDYEEPGGPSEMPQDQAVSLPADSGRGGGGFRHRGRARMGGAGLL